MWQGRRGLQRAEGWYPGGSLTQDLPSTVGRSMHWTYCGTGGKLDDFYIIGRISNAEYIQKISILPPGKFLFCTPLPPGNSSLASYFASKILVFKTPPPPPPLEFPMNFRGVGMDFFLELHNLRKCAAGFGWVPAKLKISRTNKSTRLQQKTKCKHHIFLFYFLVSAV